MVFASDALGHTHASMQQRRQRQQRPLPLIVRNARPQISHVVVNARTSSQRAAREQCNAKCACVCSLRVRTLGPARAHTHTQYAQYNGRSVIGWWWCHAVRTLTRAHKTLL